MSFSFIANFADPDVRTVNTKSVDTQGFYKVKLVSAEFYSKDTMDRAMISARVLEGPQKGRVVRTGMNIPTKYTDERKAKFFLGMWKALVLSIGKAASKKAKITWNTFKGKEAYCEFIPRATKEDWDETLWLSEAEYLEFLDMEGDMVEDDDVQVEDDVEEEEDEEYEEEEEVEEVEEEPEEEVEEDVVPEPAPKKKVVRRRKAPSKKAASTDPLAMAADL